MKIDAEVFSLMEKIKDADLQLVTSENKINSLILKRTEYIKSLSKSIGSTFVYEGTIYNVSHRKDVWFLRKVGVAADSKSNYVDLTPPKPVQHDDDELELL